MAEEITVLLTVGAQEEITVSINFDGKIGPEGPAAPAGQAQVYTGNFSDGPPIDGNGDPIVPTVDAAIAYDKSGDKNQWVWNSDTQLWE